HAVGYEWAAVVSGLELDGDVAHVRRELEGGVEELVDVELPAVFTIQTGINEPRYASLRGIRQAQSKEIAPKALGDLGLGPGDVEAAVEL
ncbi:MAG: electron transfer flavoprotein subunit beta/FixA family protein, partial [Actinobacteria bacterium]|nr:electron transfer flavoprotein subunit beta/FixA family protein [Actinomycetota bacterium]NIU70043.1 electron transfer flavoprotein subunit beta/FixA family protein [Actinomycetota bacterium]NIX24177.1 electron transfer flavoprotein subunit beta/FixA family protein [Actinomycetota bacterium]